MTNPILSKREWEVIDLLMQGKSNKQIALALGISQRTAEFHLSNIYAKFQVSTRVELILKLAHLTGNVKWRKLRQPAVAEPAQTSENRSWYPLEAQKTSQPDEEVDMKIFIKLKYVLTSIVTALAAGAVWLFALRQNNLLSDSDVTRWSGLLAATLILVGLAVGLVASRKGSSLLKVCLSTLFGAGLGPVVIPLLMTIAVTPLAKMAERMGFFDASTMPGDIASTLGTLVMITLWLALGIGLGTLLLALTIKKPTERAA